MIWAYTPFNYYNFSISALSVFGWLHLSNLKCFFMKSMATVLVILNIKYITFRNKTMKLYNYTRKSCKHYKMIQNVKYTNIL